MFTYALLFSLILSSILSVVTVRYVADMLYSGNTRAILSIILRQQFNHTHFRKMCCGVFLMFSGISMIYQILSILFFVTLLVVWMEMNFLDCSGDYQNVMITFAAALIFMLCSGYVLIQYTNLGAIVSLLLTAWAAYGLMAVRYFSLLLRYFPKGKGSSLRFLKWIEKYPRLLFIGLLIYMGLFGHLIIMWNSPLGIPVQGFFIGVPAYDVSALIAIGSILISTITFVTATETKFQPLYRKYFSLLNGKGNILDIETTEQKMIQTLDEEMGYLIVKQVIMTILFISIGTILLPRTALGFTSDMLGIYRMLCVGYVSFTRSATAFS
ncbi:MAG: exopolysaccharide Pel transporter PelG [Alkalibacterium sp.]|nr:exopolysaccharide Pel transporter PelG [Alkalibacterium sp.]